MDTKEKMQLKEKSEIIKQAQKRVKDKNGIMLDIGVNFNKFIIDEIKVLNKTNLMVSIVFDYLKEEYRELIENVSPVVIQCEGNEKLSLYKVVDRDNEQKYTFYILSDKDIYANPYCNEMFRYYGDNKFFKFISIKYNNFNTSETIDMNYMFLGCKDISILDLSGFDTSNVVNMTSMFAGCHSLKTLDISNFITCNVVSMQAMFRDCTSLEKLEISNFDTSNVTDMSDMFESCDALSGLDLSSFNTSKVTDMDGMFFACYSLTTLDLSGFDTSCVVDMTEMFKHCEYLATIYVSSSFITSNVKDSDCMFDECHRLEGANGTSITSNVVDVTYARVDTPSTPGYFTLKTT